MTLEGWSRVALKDTSPSDRWLHPSLRPPWSTVSDHLENSGRRALKLANRSQNQPIEGEERMAQLQSLARECISFSDQVEGLKTKKSRISSLPEAQLHAPDSVWERLSTCSETGDLSSSMGLLLLGRWSEHTLWDCWSHVLKLRYKQTSVWCICFTFIDRSSLPRVTLAFTGGNPSPLVSWSSTVALIEFYKHQHTRLSTVLTKS